ncbi:amidohydrolase, imidazolonepropionase [Salinarchaeum sp. Harcht-Bsk1]|uniref:metal-dependent hydrolase family protein n=1 Tax=Salinarchaeum sp. Harcht-Bsk1 TaxID=1333523 RepID=UPI0003423EE7|nr:amidohydrolase family protein [Salinarchaeum sp. Harcht-Bsk1]AGN00656.1 amidohydrolase, imidazolonepropionase [Salinarchaeum sp. Harcht-Bsk1]
MRVIDADLLVTGRDAPPIEDGRIVIDEEDGTIDEVGTQEDVSATGDAAHEAHPVVTPGLIDAHLHLTGARSMDPMQWVIESSELGAARATADLRDLLAAGFTSVRDVGSQTGLGLRDAVAEGSIPGPRIYTSAQSISQTAGHGDSHFLPYEWVSGGERGIGTLADGPDECRKEARKRIRDGVDVLKIMTTGGVLSEKDAPDQSQFTDAEVQAFVEEAHRVGIPVASHAQGAPGIKTALRNGVDTIEHGFYLDEECLDLFEETGATFVPTLAIMYRLIEHGADHGVPEYGLEKSREASESHFDAVERAYDAGIPIATGTDFLGPELVPHGENALELELLADEVGMDEHDVLQSATRIAARTVPDDDVGTLEAGNRADVLALGSDPLEDISAVRDVEAVWTDGAAVEF